MITPFPVPTHRRFPPIRRAVIRTKEKPSLPVPVNYKQVSVEWSDRLNELLIKSTAADFVSENETPPPLK